MDLFFQQLVNGVVLGATYGLVALGYTMVYGIVQLINFAHGEIFMLGGFGALTTYLALPTGTPTGVALPLMLIGGVIVSVSAAVVMERFAYRPLRNAPRLAPLITALGVSIFLQELVRNFYPDAKSPRTFPQLVSPSYQVNLGGDVRISAPALLTVVLAVVGMVSLTLFVRRSRTGRAMQATAQDPDTARLMGIDTDRIIVTAFVLGAALAAVAGMAQGLRFGQVDFKMGFITGVKAFTAAVLGGIGNISGAVLGGFTLGIVEVMATQYAPGEFGGAAWKDAWAFVVLILVLVFRPYGLLGERVAARA
ncbi:MAG TPA: branched-chain amino acid ABC transporter permease [Mycobacteriales bacterium]|nr:branched-chain amino acid ABC transporter permease [Mycobacteriales bacterium]